ncbi:hypothetical protein [Aequorivita sinensis]|uniref:hypothetical protein n=1 Tax=Aequorivita sinensis TaxID=1382458 RepID=UPI001123F373|nr:hypothetical protein [Aequorivita sinensis]
MQNFQQNLKNKPTLFLIIGIVVLIIGIPAGLYGLTLNGGASLGGVLILIGVIAFIPFLVIDRILVNRIKPLKLSIYEFILIVIFLIFNSSLKRKIVVDLTDYKNDYFVVVFNDGNLKNSELNWSFPFNKKVKYNSKSIIIPAEFKDKYQIDIEIPKSWSGTRMNPDRINDIGLKIYTSANTKLNRTEIDSLAAKEIKTVGNTVYN